MYELLTVGEPVLVVRLFGNTHLEEVQAAIAEIMQTIPHPQRERCLVDMLELQGHEFHYDEVSTLLAFEETLPVHPGRPRVALVAQRPEVFGMLRMIELRARTFECRTFHTVTEARRWLESVPGSS